MGVSVFFDGVDRDLNDGMIAEDVLRRFAAWVDSWVSGHQENHTRLENRIAALEARVSRLEAVVQTDKQNINEVDASVRQTWEALDARLKKLEEG